VGMVTIMFHYFSLRIGVVMCKASLSKNRESSKEIFFQKGVTKKSKKGKNGEKCSVIFKKKYKQLCSNQVFQKTLKYFKRSLYLA